MVQRLHDPGCVAQHAGDCAVSGLFTEQQRTETYFVLAYRDDGAWYEWVRSPSLDRLEDTRKRALHSGSTQEYRVAQVIETWTWL